MPHSPDLPTPAILGPAIIEQWTYGAGNGLLRWQGKVYFVSGGVPGDTVRFRVERENRKVGFGQVTELLLPGPNRRQAPCPEFGRCGGCQWLNGSYEVQLAAKQRAVADAFRSFPAAPECQPIRSVGEFHTRWRAVLHTDSERGRVGFYAAGSREVVPLPECVVLHPPLQQAARLLERRYGTALPRNVALVAGEADGQPVVDAFAQERSNSSQAPSEEAPDIALEEGTGRYWRLHLEEQRCEELTGPELLTLQTSAGQLSFRVDTFFQSSPQGLELLLGLIRDWLDTHPSQALWDLYSGVGAYSMLCAGRGLRVHSVESAPAVEACLRRNREWLGLGESQGSYDLCSAEEFLAERAPARLAPEAIILNPPRVGCTAQVIAGVGRSGARHLCYVSCNPMTLQRDCSRLAEYGFRLEAVHPLDLFPQTYHVETVAMLSRGMG